MVLIGNTLVGIATVLGLVISTYKIVLIASVLLSWLQPDPSHPLVRFVRQVTEPVFRAIRRRLPASFFSAGIDFTPMLVFLLLILLEYAVVNGLNDVGRNMLYRDRVNNMMILPPNGANPSGPTDPIFQGQ